MFQFYGIDNEDQIMSSNLLSIENLIEDKVRNKFYQEATLSYRDIPTPQIFRARSISQFPEIRYTKLNKEYRQETISIFKLRTQSYHFQQDLHMSHYPVRSQLCMCGRRDTFKHIFECVYQSDILRKFYHQFPGKDMYRLITYDQIYLNQQSLLSNNQKQTFKLKFFTGIYQELKYLEKIQIINTNNKLETKQDSTRKSREELEDERSDA